MKKENGLKELRADIRQAAGEGASIEFQPSEKAMVYQFKLREWSAKGVGILVRNDSKVLGFIEVGQVIAVKIHNTAGHISSDPVNAEIRHISEPENGRHPDHKIIGLSILA